MTSQEPDARSPYFAATTMPDRDWWAALWPDPDAVLRLLGIRPGMRVVDLCCGDGYFTAPLSRLVENGRVIAIDLSAEMLRLARHAIARVGGENVRFVRGDARELPDYIDEPVDVVFLANTLHGVDDRKAMCAAIRGALAVGGRLVIVNWHALPREQTPVLGQPRGPSTELRMSPEATRSIVEPAGFRQVRVADVGPYHYAAIFAATELQDARAAPPSPRPRFQRRG